MLYCYVDPFFRCSTIGAIIMTPLLTKLLAGQLVPVDAAVRNDMLDYFTPQCDVILLGTCNLEEILCTLFMDIYVKRKPQRFFTG